MNSRGGGGVEDGTVHLEDAKHRLNINMLRITSLNHTPNLEKYTKDTKDNREYIFTDNKTIARIRNLGRNNKQLTNKPILSHLKEVVEKYLVKDRIIYNHSCIKVTK